ncbi:unnamed protein product [Vicia faba]|uniref:tRNA-uridine aminocarboxypropyltransferase n=1 Tax=Vicia faba TaxID=3906 RepID=A0AAV0YR41_VICFA|nr:unnamed protein product [Vicia faba]
MGFCLTHTQFNLNLFHTHNLLLRKSLKTLSSMSQAKSKRPICPSCSKPTRTCLCSRILTPPIPNSVHVTILQHALECNHPLNSTRIAKLGLNNLTIATVSDVNFQSRFLIRLLHSISNSLDNVSNGLFAQNYAQHVLANSLVDTVNHVSDDVNKIPIHPNCDDIEPAITVTIAKYACEALSKGFLVKKLQKKQLNREESVEEYEEFDIEVKNLIVLDGTWAKAKRIYSENPWLNILPHLKLEVNEMSLYGDVRSQPKAGYLSTIESIVFALKAIGEDHRGLDNLLDTFESMVGDQRRCKDERLSKLLPS